jgi:hypothetical protein
MGKQAAISADVSIGIDATREGSGGVFISSGNLIYAANPSFRYHPRSLGVKALPLTPGEPLA